MAIVGDIIIPSYNNGAHLVLTLRALFVQKITSSWQWRIIISDDGSTDKTRDLINHLRSISPWPLSVLRQSHLGAATARNRAIAASQAPVILFLGSDIVLRPDALQAHADFHDAYPDKKYAALGHLHWDPRLNPTPFMEWIIHGGPQNDFDSLLAQTVIDPSHYFYGSHLSLKREIIGQERFNEKFILYGWEDLEFGRRLAARGLILKPLLNARGVHHHYYSTADILQRQRLAGASLWLYQKIHPDTPLLPPPAWLTGCKLFFSRVSGLALALRFLLNYSGKRWTTPRLFLFITAVEYWHGLLSAKKRQE